MFNTTLAGFGCLIFFGVILFSVKNKLLNQVGFAWLHLSTFRRVFSRLKVHSFTMRLRNNSVQQWKFFENYIRILLIALLIPIILAFFRAFSADANSLIDESSIWLFIVIILLYWVRSSFVQSDRDSEIEKSLRK